MKKGDVVKFKEVVDPGDADLFMVVVEMRGDRVLVQALVDMTFQPQSVYPVEDLVVVVEAEEAANKFPEQWRHLVREEKTRP